MVSKSYLMKRKVNKLIAAANFQRDQKGCIYAIIAWGVNDREELLFVRSALSHLSIKVTAMNFV